MSRNIVLHFLHVNFTRDFINKKDLTSDSFIVLFHIEPNNLIYNQTVLLKKFSPQ